MCVKRGEDDGYSWGLSPRHLDLGQDKGQAVSLESSVSVEAVEKVLCSPLQPEAEEAGQ